jgi:hypothetical protein
MTDNRTEVLEMLGDDVARAPIEVHLQGFAATPLDVVSLGACLLRVDEAGPILCDLLERATAGDELSEQEKTLIFRSVFLLGGARYTPGFPALLRFLGLPTEEMDHFLGDCVTEALARIVAGMFDGDTEALLTAVCDSSRDEYVRDALLGAATFLTWDGRIPRERFEDFLKSFFRDRLAPDDDHVWCGWQEAIALLGLRSFVPQVEQAFATGLVPNYVMTLRDFHEDLAVTERAPDDGERFEKAHLGYIDDVLEELENWPVYENSRPASPSTEGRTGSLDRAEPILNPHRHIGRNDLCPCGSGKKYKKCCLAG